MRRLLAVLAAALTAAFLIAGCSRSDNTADESTTSPPATTVAPVVTVAAAATTTTEATTTTAPTTTAAAPVGPATGTITFEGNACVYDGPVELDAGPVTYDFVNASGRPFQVNLMFHRGDETVQDMVDYLGPDPSDKTMPWWVDATGTLDYMVFTEEWPEFAGRSIRWEGDLVPGTYTIICGAPLPDFATYFGTGLTVEG